jgi:c-di-GMP-binding flagellar brake protein YcgR
MAEERRIIQRRKIYTSCQVECENRLASGRVIDASQGGIAVLLPEAGDLVKGDTRVHIPPAHQPADESLETIVLRTRLVDLQKKSKGHRLGLKVEKVESGESDWKKLCREFQ